MKNTLLICIALLFLIGCTNYKEFSIPQKYVYIYYKDSNNIGKPRMESAIQHYKKAFSDGQIISETRNDTIFYSEVEMKGMIPWKPWRYETRFKASKLKCSKKIRVDVGRLSFYFCLEELKKLAAKLSKSNDEHTSKLYKLLNDDLAGIEEEYDKKADAYGFADSFFLSKVLRNINFEIKDKAGEQITEARIGDLDVGWAISDEIYLLNTQKDTVAAFFNTYFSR